MRRGEVWTVSSGTDCAGKPRSVVIVQDDSFDATDSVTICLFTTDLTEAPLFRLPIEPNERNGLRTAARLMVDKITPVLKSKAGERVGRLDDEDVVRLNQADGVSRSGGVAEDRPEPGMMRRAVGVAWQPGRWPNGRIGGNREDIWLVSVMRDDLGSIGLEQKTLNPIDNPFGTRLSPLSSEQSVTRVSGSDI